MCITAANTPNMSVPHAASSLQHLVSGSDAVFFLWILIRFFLIGKCFKGRGNSDYFSVVLLTFHFMTGTSVLFLQRPAPCQKCSVGTLTLHCLYTELPLFHILRKFSLCPQDLLLFLIQDIFIDHNKLFFSFTVLIKDLYISCQNCFTVFAGFCCVRAVWVATANAKGMFHTVPSAPCCSLGGMLSAGLASFLWLL